MDGQIIISYFKFSFPSLKAQVINHIADTLKSETNLKNEKCT